MKQHPIKLSKAGKTGVSAQFGALCYRVKNGKVQILMITTRGTGRWIIPRGWPMHGLTPSKAAAREAFEEAGVLGRASPACVGIYSYAKQNKDGFEPRIVSVFPVQVETLLSDYPEARVRKRKWMSPAKAAKQVEEPDLAALLKEFDPSRLPKGQ